MKEKINTYRKTWNQKQKLFREVIEGGDQHEKAIGLFIIQHGVFHSTRIALEAAWSFEDLLFDGLSEDIFRRIPRGAEHSIAWLMWHLARCEDITMNLLTAGRRQVVNEWQEKLKIKAADTGNAMSADEISELSKKIDFEALRGYRTAVGAATREVVNQLSPDQIKLKVEPDRIRDLLNRGIVLPGAIGIAEYWGSRSITGLLLMPPTRHNMVHFNEAFQLLGKKI